MRVIFRSRWMALTALAVLVLPLLVDAVHHLRGSEMHLPHSAFLHRIRVAAPIGMGAVAAFALAAFATTRNRWEKICCAAIALLFGYECVRYAWWIRTHHFLHGPYSWIFWLPAIAALVTRTTQLFSSSRDVPTR